MRNITDSDKKRIKDFILNELKKTECVPIRVVFKEFKNIVKTDSLQVFRNTIKYIVNDIPEIEARKGRYGGLALKQDKPKIKKKEDKFKPYLSNTTQIKPESKKENQDIWIYNKRYSVRLTDAQVRTLIKHVIRAEENEVGPIIHNNVSYAVKDFDGLKIEMLDRFLVYMLGAKIVVVSSLK